MQVLLPCLGEVATLLFAFKQKANDGVDGGVILMHGCVRDNSQD